MPNPLMNNLKLTAKSLMRDLKDTLSAKSIPQLSDQETEWLEKIREDGFCVIEDYWDPEQVASLRTRLYEHLSDSDRDFEGGARFRIRSGSGYDEGIARIYHVDKLIPELTEFRFDPFPLKLAHAYYGRPFYSGMLIFQHNPESTAVTRTFHVDDFVKEFKSFLYLDDVDESNGPFTFIRGSHRKYGLRLKKQILGNKDDARTTFYESDVASIMDQEVKITGKAGSLVLADVRGLHRGSPQKGRSRAVLVNYIIGENKEIEFKL